MINSKTINAIKPILWNGIYQLLPSLVNLLLSLAVVFYAGSELWGKIVAYQLVYYLAGILVAWGNKEYLLLHFSKNGGNISTLWKTNVLTRFTLLCLPILAALFFVYTSHIAIHIAIWILSRFVTQSLEVIAVSEKKYNRVLLAEIAPILITLVVLFGFIPLTKNSLLWMLTSTQILRLLASVFLYKKLVFKSWPSVQANGLKVSFPFFVLSTSGFLQSKIDLYCTSALANKEELGNYQVFTSYVFLFLLIPGFLLTPYSRHIYRLGYYTKKQLRKKLLYFAGLSAIPFLACCFLIIRFLYGIKIDTLLYVYAYLYLVAIFWVLIDIFELYKHNQQTRVMWLSFLSIVANALVCLLFIPILGISGAMLANVISHLLFSVLIKYSVHKIKVG